MTDAVTRGAQVLQGEFTFRGAFFAPPRAKVVTYDATRRKRDVEQRRKDSHIPQLTRPPKQINKVGANNHSPLPNSRLR